MSKGQKLAKLLARRKTEDLQEGPGLHEAAMEAAKRGDTGGALSMLKKLQKLLQLSDEEFGRMLGQGAQGRDSVLDRRTVDSPMRKAEGGEVERPKLSRLQAIGRSLAGAVPFKGQDPEFVEYYGDIPSHLKTSLKSQWWGINPTTDELEYAGPLSDTVHAPYPDEELLRYDPETYHDMVENFNTRREQTNAIPGIVDDSVSLLGLLGVANPETQETALERVGVLEDRLRAEEGIGPPEGFPQHMASAAGFMLGQLPVPSSLIKGAIKPGGEAGSRLKQMLTATPKFGAEFLSPIIDPKVGNYLGGALFGGTLGTVLDSEDSEDIPLDIQALVEKAEAGDEEAYNELQALYDEYLEQQTELDERRESNRQLLNQIGKSGAF